MGNHRTCVKWDNTVVANKITSIFTLVTLTRRGSNGKASHVAGTHEADRTFLGGGLVLHPKENDVCLEHLFIPGGALWVSGSSSLEPWPSVNVLPAQLSHVLTFRGLSPVWPPTLFLNNMALCKIAPLKKHP